MLRLLGYSLAKRAGICLSNPFTSSSSPWQVPVLEEVEGKVLQSMVRFTKRKDISRKDTFEQLGLDSLDAIEVVVVMEAHFGFDIPDEQARSISSVEGAISTFYKHMNTRVANKIVIGEQHQIK